MMRRAFASGLVAGAMVISLAGMAVAQDDELRMGDDPAYFERVEVPEAGIAVSFPPEWDVEVEMEFKPGESGDPGTSRWSVLVADNTTNAWCDIVRYLDPVSDQTDLTQELAQSYADDPGSTADWSPVELPVGEAHRIDIHDGDGDEYTAIYVFDSESARYYLTCQSWAGGPRDWLDIAETLELLPEVDIIDPETDPDDQPDPDRVEAVSIGGYELDTVDIAEAGVSMLLPFGWMADAPMDRHELTLPPEFADVAPAYFVNLLSIESDDGDWCGLQRHEDNPTPFEVHAEWSETFYADGAPEGVIVEGTFTLVDGDLAHRIDVTSDTDPGASRIWLLEKGGVRLSFLCGSDAGMNPAWQAMAESVRPLDDEPVVDPEPEPEPTPHDPGRVELSEAGVAISFPPAWDVDTATGEVDFSVPSESGEMTPATRYVTAFPPGAWCAAYRFDDHPLYLEDHVAWSEQVAIHNSDDPATTSTMSVTLPVGDAIRVIETHESGRVNAAYHFDLDGYRHLFACGSESPPDDGWLSVAETIESLTAGPVEDAPPGVPDDAVAWDEVGPFASTIAVDETSVMRASCEVALWIEFPDGTFEERVECLLDDDPVDSSESQGVVPAERVTIEGGACEWVSDFWLATDGSETWADSWSVTVEPDGTAVATSAYGVEMLDCSDA